METKIQRLKKDKAFFDLNTDLKEQFAAFKRLEDAQNELAQIRISIYSTQNADEFMAEAFAQAKLGTEQIACYPFRCNFSTGIPYQLNYVQIHV